MPRSSSAVPWDGRAFPVTVMRDGPLGPGSMQLFVESDPNVTYFELAGERSEELYELAVFDLLVNNADRKAGHCLLDADGAIWSIDHGLTFHSEWKVRTVMLDLWSSPIPRSLHQSLQALAPELEAGGCLAERLSDVLLPEEIASLANRLESMLADPVLPAPRPVPQRPLAAGLAASTSSRQRRQQYTSDSISDNDRACMRLSRRSVTKPESTDRRREDSGRGQGSYKRDDGCLNSGRLEVGGGLQALLWAPMGPVLAVVSEMAG